jgi:eukaryotic-like serine/threonine-protein kinase
VDGRSDIFSFGAMLYEMATGARAFTGATVADTLTAVRSTQPKAPTTISDTVPGDLEKVILRCFRKDPDRRFQHIDDVKVALQEIKEDTESGTAPATPRARAVRSYIVMGTAAVIMVGAITAWLWWSQRQAQAPPARVVPLTTLRGHESWPTFSPDGSQVAFTWSGDNDENRDIYVKFVRSAEVRRLTSDPQPDFAPSWSPDGRQIAYLRETGPEQQAGKIHVLSALGGTDLKLSDLLVSAPLTWSADGSYPAARRVPAEAGDGDTGIYLIPVRGGGPRRLTRPSPGRFDAAPAFSPDERRLAYASCDLWSCDGHVIDLNSDLAPVGTLKKLWKQSGWRVTSVAWARDGNSVIYPDYLDTFVSYLWRVSVEGNLDVERIELAGAGAIMPATLTAKDRLAFARNSYDMDVYRFEAGQPARPVLTSTFADTEARLSPDGRRIAFCSARSGDQNDIWVADATEVPRNS